MNKVFFALLIFSAVKVQAQFAPPVGQNGTTAIAHDSSIVDYWLEDAVLVRGYEDIAVGGNLASHGAEADAEGEADNVVVSLGDSGYVTYILPNPIMNHDGYDFAVFENSFSDDYLELAFVEVSSDGQNFVRFPATSNIQTTTQTDAFGLTDATEIHNLAGKYRGYYGTPFELDDVADSNNVDINAITHIRVVDVVGSIDPNYGTRDHLGNLINDPYPSAFASGGFDLDGVAILKPYSLSIGEKELNISAYPNPASDHINIKMEEPGLIEIYSVGGQLVYREEMMQLKNTVDLSGWNRGVYFIRVFGAHVIKIAKD